MVSLFTRKAPNARKRGLVRGMLLGAIFSVFVFATPTADAGGDASISIPVYTVRNAKGRVFVALYNERNWLEPGRYLAAQKVQAQKGTVIARFKNLPRGRYGVAVWHDENANNRVDTNVLGLPKEGYGFSRVTPRRKPKFDQVAVSAAPSAYAPIRLRY